MINNKEQIAVILTHNGTQLSKKIDVAATLLARDYKGMSSFGSNAIIEVDDESESE